MKNEHNLLHVQGKITSDPVHDHTSHGEKFYRVTVSVPRTSGTEDHLPVTISEKLMDGVCMAKGATIALDGQLRTYNKDGADGKTHHIITVFATDIVKPGEANANSVTLQGAVSKQPVYRTTPYGREICDILIKVQRPNNIDDVLPCVAWGRSARWASHLAPGALVKIEGRMQSRPYTKRMMDGTVLDRTAYEVSIGTIRPAEEEST